MVPKFFKMNSDSGSIMAIFRKNCGDLSQYENHKLVRGSLDV